MNLRKTFFILPNLFTLSSVFCGFLAITLAASVHGREAGSLDTLFQAAVAICFAFFFDLADGRVARLTKTQSELGLQLDSLADVISFGAAPALLVYKWGLTRFGLWGIIIGFVFCGAAALRLARFNVLAMRSHQAGDKPGKFILGLPVPVAASVLVSLVVLNHQLRLGDDYAMIGQASLAVLVLVLSYLMVSRIRFRSFKDLHWSRRTAFGLLAVLAGISVALMARMPTAFIFVGLMAAYLCLGLFEEVLFFRKRRAEEKAAEVPAEGGAHSDEEVLAELRGD
jgi:CDP-diacylglycerol--serine O-phosphatidyltransferase